MCLTVILLGDYDAAGDLAYVNPKDPKTLLAAAEKICTYLGRGSDDDKGGDCGQSKKLASWYTSW